MWSINPKNEGEIEMWAFLTIVGIVATAIWGTTEIVKVGTRYSENVQRIKHGYPTLDGDGPRAGYIPGPKPDRGEVYIDMTEPSDREPSRYNGN
jgi:hypothetical protein